MKPLLDDIAKNIACVSYMKHTSVSSISFEGFFQQYNDHDVAYVSPRGMWLRGCLSDKDVVAIAGE